MEAVVTLVEALERSGHSTRGEEVEERAREAFEAVASGQAQDEGTTCSAVENVVGTDPSAVKAVKTLIHLAIYSTDDVADALVKAKAGMDPSKTDALKLIHSVLGKGAPKWRERKVEDMISLPKLDKASWQLVNQTKMEPKVAFKLKTSEPFEEQISFEASRGMLTVLTESMKRIKNDLQSVSDA